ncbi:MFS transporter OS=Streptomyces alboniger OX=132473 GN=CP975_10510 PE=4 SV=1 [Streptomyces alboniger]
MTEQGSEVADRLADARAESLAKLLGDWWDPDRPTDLVQLVKELNSELQGRGGAPARRAPSTRFS